MPFLSRKMEIITKIASSSEMLQSQTNEDHNRVEENTTRKFWTFQFHISITVYSENKSHIIAWQALYDFHYLQKNWNLPHLHWA